MASFDCSCWQNYPNPLRKPINGVSPCDNYACISHLDKSGRGKKTHCIKKERLESNGKEHGTNA